MKIQITLLIIFVVSSNLMAQPRQVDSLGNGDLIIENYENEEIGELPKMWLNMAGDENPSTFEGEEREAYQYRIMEEDGNKFLRYSGNGAKHLNFPLLEIERLDIYENPLLSWKWRVYDLPENANEDRDSRNDAAASIYVVFDFGRVLFRRVPKSIKYTWSSTLSAGTELSKFFGNQKIVVVESGEEELGQWKTFERNIVADYRRLFGDDPPHTPIAILILSDGDSVVDYAMADYDDIMLKKISE